MKIVKFENAERFANNDKCKGYEYPLGDKDINISSAEITGRYPDKGYCANMECKEIIYVIEGTGTLFKKDERIDFAKGDVILIEKGEEYYWDAHCTILMPCTPAWYPEQHKMIEGEE